MTQPQSLPDWAKVLFGVQQRPDWVSETDPLVSRLVASFPGRAIGQLHIITSGANAQHLPDEAYASSALLQVATQSMRWTVGETEPTAANAFQADVGTILKITGPADLRSFRHRNAGIFDATLFLQFFA
jgi:hypothetical protein